MIRILFSALAVLAAVLAIVLEQRLLYVAAALMLLIVAILWIAEARRRHRATRKSFKPVTTAPTAPQENLKALGIMDIRPKEPTRPRTSEADGPGVSLEEQPAAATNEPAAPKAIPPTPPAEKLSAEKLSAEKLSAEESPAEESATAEMPVEESSIEERPEPAETTPVAATHEPVAPPASTLNEFVIQPPDADARAEAHSNGTGPSAAEAHAEAVLGPFLQALRAALGAHTVCVLKQEDVAFEYQVVARAGEDGPMPPGTTFSTTKPLLTARMAGQPLTVRRVSDDDLPRHSLGYSAAPTAIRRVAVAPAPRPASDTTTYFLLADTPRTDLLDQPQAHTLLSQFARLLGVLLDAVAPTPAPAAEPATEATARPRREIIAEEMQHARAQNQVLALALVYLNRAEDIAVAGQDALGDAEHLLKTRLGQAAHNGRVVRFGELTYGVFYDGDLPEVEAWGAQIQETLAQETGLLEGGVSIGIALLQDRHQTPDAFRTDATEALREAYETGTCTILE